VLEENDQLRAKIDGLNEEYNKIGLEVFKVRIYLFILFTEYWYLFFFCRKTYTLNQFCGAASFLCGSGSGSGCKF
jgi:hypothetical protein